MLYGSPSLSISEIIVKSNIGPLNVSWRYNTGRENITSSMNAILNDTAFIIIAHNYTSSGIYPTEAKFKAGGRCDVIDLTDGTYEVLHTETDEMFETKVLKYPGEFRVVKIK